MDFLYQVDSLMDPAEYPHGRPLPDSPYVELSWYCPDRPTPIAPYDSLIAGYAGLEGQLKANAERYMDEWFTRDEVAQLLTYLCIELGHTVSVRRLPVPMNIFLDIGDSVATPVARVLADPSWRVALTLSGADDGFPLATAASAYYLAAPHEAAEEGPGV
jgi:hypothetical protein